MPHEAYLRISHIEMEKARKMVESDKARQMMADIAARLREIETEKDALLKEMGEGRGAPARVRPGRRRAGAVSK